MRFQVLRVVVVAAAALFIGCGGGGGAQSPSGTLSGQQALPLAPTAAPPVSAGSSNQRPITVAQLVAEVQRGDYSDVGNFNIIDFKPESDNLERLPNGLWRNPRTGE